MLNQFHTTVLAERVRHGVAKEGGREVRWRRRGATSLRTPECALIRESRRAETGRSRRHLGRFISEDAAVAVVKYFARPAGKGGAEINANAFHGLHPRSLYLAQRDARLGRIHMTSFGTLIQEEDIRRVQRTCSAQRGHGGGERRRRRRDAEREVVERTRRLAPLSSDNWHLN